jgi:flagellar protein FliS
MSYPTTPLEYRRAALQHSSVVGLVIALCDTLTGDLQRAAKALDSGDIESRCNELGHGFKVLTQLDAMLDMTAGGATAIQLRRFYQHIRQQMLLAQFKLDPAILRQQVQAVLEVRGAWQQLDETATAAPSNPAQGYAAPAPSATSTSSFSCSG